jgi:hypothetical protein
MTLKASDMTMEEAQEEIRQMKWDLRILSDQAIRVADALPPEDRERIADIADRIADAAQNLITAINQDEVDSEAKMVARLQGGLAEVQQQLKLIARELDEVADGLFPFDPFDRGQLFTRHRQKGNLYERRWNNKGIVTTRT